MEPGSRGSGRRSAGRLRAERRPRHARAGGRRARAGASGEGDRPQVRPEHLDQLPPRAHARLRGLPGPAPQRDLRDRRDRGAPVPRPRHVAGAAARGGGGAAPALGPGRAELLPRPAPGRSGSRWSRWPRPPGRRTSRTSRSASTSPRTRPRSARRCWSAMPPRQRHRFLATHELRPFTTRTRTDLEELEAELGAVRSDAPVSEHGEFRDGVSCTAALVPRRTARRPGVGGGRGGRRRGRPRPGRRRGGAGGRRPGRLLLVVVVALGHVLGALPPAPPG